MGWLLGAGLGVFRRARRGPAATITAAELDILTVTDDPAEAVALIVASDGKLREKRPPRPRPWWALGERVPERLRR